MIEGNIVCDRCGNKAEVHRSLTGSGDLTIEVGGWCTFKVWKISYDLCPSCKKELDEFLGLKMSDFNPLDYDDNVGNEDTSDT